MERLRYLRLLGTVLGALGACASVRLLQSDQPAMPALGALLLVSSLAILLALTADRSLPVNREAPALAPAPVLGGALAAPPGPTLRLNLVAVGDDYNGTCNCRLDPGTTIQVCRPAAAALGFYLYQDVRLVFVLPGGACIDAGLGPLAPPAQEAP